MTTDVKQKKKTGNGDVNQFEVQRFIDLGRDASNRWQNGPEKDAIENFQKALDINPKSLDALMAMALEYSKGWKRDEIIVYVDRMLEIDPNYHDALVMQAEFFSYKAANSKGSWNNAEDLFLEEIGAWEKLIETNPKNKEFWKQLCDAYQSLRIRGNCFGRLSKKEQDSLFEKGLFCTNEMLEIDPLDNGLLNAKENYLLELGRFDDLKKAEEKHVELLESLLKTQMAAVSAKLTGMLSSDVSELKALEKELGRVDKLIDKIGCEICKRKKANEENQEVEARIRRLDKDDFYLSSEVNSLLELGQNCQNAEANAIYVKTLKAFEALPEENRTKGVWLKSIIPRLHALIAETELDKTRALAEFETSIKLFEKLAGETEKADEKSAFMGGIQDTCEKMAYIDAENGEKHLGKAKEIAGARLKLQKQIDAEETDKVRVLENQAEFKFALANYEFQLAELYSSRGKGDEGSYACYVNAIVLYEAVVKGNDRNYFLKNTPRNEAYYTYARLFWDRVGACYEQLGESAKAAKCYEYAGENKSDFNDFAARMKEIKKIK